MVQLVPTKSKSSVRKEPSVVWPPIPHRIELAGGWIKVTRPKVVEAGKRNADWDQDKRVIRLERGLTNAEAWKYFFHEIVHAWLDDSRMFVGIIPLEEQQEEAICEIVASGMHYRMRRDLERKSGGTT